MPAERLAIALEEGVPVISLSWGDPAPWVEQIHAAGALLVHMVGTTAAAVAAEDAGVDVIVAQGYEASGHVEGQTSIMALLPEMVDAVAPTPVLAAGGIGDGRGLAAALCLGASGVWMGTRFLLSDEADAHPDYQGWLLEAGASDTIHTTLFRGGWPPEHSAPHPAEQIAPALGRGRTPGTGPRPGRERRHRPHQQRHPHHALPRRLPRRAAPPATWKAWCSTRAKASASIHEILPAAEIVQSVADQARSVLSRLGSND